MVFVTIVLVLLIKFLQSNPNDSEAWLTVPFLFLSAAILPILFRKKNLSDLGLDLERFVSSLRVLCKTSLVIFPVFLCGIFLLKHYKVPLPMCPIVPEKRWLSWLVYQFMYIAISEEVFFRGYLQSNIYYLLTLTLQKNAAFLALMSVTISAGIFAVFHSMLLGNILAIITFIPGLILGWLFFKTKSIFAPILFHGLANVSYGFIGTVLT
jgi:membrane protease YdiL (CAAX protease family)